MRLSSFCANADVIGLASFTFVANIDVVTAGGEIVPAESPKAMLLLPVVLLSALNPKHVLPLPFVLKKGRHYPSQYCCCRSR